MTLEINMVLNKEIGSMTASLSVDIYDYLLHANEMEYSSFLLHIAELEQNINGFSLINNAQVPQTKDKEHHFLKNFVCPEVVPTFDGEEFTGFKQYFPEIDIDYEALKKFSHENHTHEYLKNVGDILKDTSERLIRRGGDPKQIKDKMDFINFVVPSDPTHKNRSDLHQVGI